jgi:hypothetical protein
MTELERALVSLGRELDVPDTPDLVPAVLAGLERRPAPPRAGRRRWAVVAVALALVAVLGALLASPEARSALSRLLWFGGAEIHLVDELPAVPPEPTELDLDLVLGRRMSLADAREAAGFPLRELEQEPDRVYVGERGTVWFLYGTPEDVRLLVAQTPDVGVDERYILRKLVTAEVVEVEVDGKPGLFIGGEPHIVALVDENGVLSEESTRLAQRVLLWEDGDLALRLEGDFSEDEAVELAESLRVRSPG